MAVAVDTLQLEFIPILSLGVLLGLYELILIHRDENFRGSHWFGHGLHSVGIMIVALFFVYNTEYFLTVTGLGEKGWPLISNPWAVRIIIGLILNIKMHASCAVLTFLGRGKFFSLIL